MKEKCDNEKIRSLRGENCQEGKKPFEKMKIGANVHEWEIIVQMMRKLSACNQRKNVMMRRTVDRR
jgi:hypothetical protein